MYATITGDSMDGDRCAVYLAALVDGEGAMGSHAIIIGNADQDIIDYASSCLDALGIGQSIRKYKMKSGKPVWHIHITKRRNIERFALSVAPSMASTKKKEQLKNMYEVKQAIKIGPTAPSRH